MISSKATVLTLIGILANILVVNADCPDLQSISLQNIEFLQGTWYLIAQSSSIQGCEGLTFTSFNMPYINVTVTEAFSGSNYQNPVFVSNNTFLVSNPDNAVFQPTQGPLISFKYKIIETDYSNYFLSYSCVGTLGTSYVYSRQTNIAQEDYDGIIENLRGLQVPENVINVQPTDCVMSSSSSTSSSSTESASN